MHSKNTNKNNRPLNYSKDYQQCSFIKFKLGKHILTYERVAVKILKNLIVEVVDLKSISGNSKINTNSTSKYNRAS